MARSALLNARKPTKALQTQLQIFLHNSKQIDTVFDAYEYHMDLCNESCSASWPAVLRGKNFKAGDYAQSVQRIFSYQPCLWALLTSTVLYCCHWPWPYLGVTRSVQRKPIGFIFSHTFHLIRMKFDVVMKQFKFNILRLLFSKIYLEGK